MSDMFNKRANAAKGPSPNESESSVKEQLAKDEESVAQTGLAVSQIDNKKKIGEFAVDWLISAVSALSILVFILICIYVFKISFNQEKLEWFLKVVYRELSDFLYKYQAVFAGLVVYMFGDSVRKKSEKK
ncbi:TPA: hypothetical protein ACN33E_004783 [Vibrio parahaemolyticus]|uniref:hypothetical protein n=1 Tax=Vibrio parahaemolyticus TaxID=670 RepID=UPI00226A838C|nr:hypothetical protein [Vibrio parahaemolyticus]MCX8905721.1 hypothetical protein [Vibrio parahaemolyticus]